MTTFLKSLSDYMLPHQQPKKKVFLLNEGSENDEKLLSPKGSRLCELKRLSFETPAAFILSTDVYSDFIHNNSLTEDVIEQIQKALNEVENDSNKVFGATKDAAPLLLAVRVGAPITNTICPPIYESSSSQSMTSESGLVGLLGIPDSWSIPGVQESILGIGVNDDIIKHLASFTNTRYALTIYAKFLVSYGITICKIPYSTYDNLLFKIMQSAHISNVSQLQESQLVELIEHFKEVYQPPLDPAEQLFNVICEAYRNWIDNIEKRKIMMDMSPALAIAIIVQQVIYGMPGILFSRNPVTGLKNDLCGDILLENGIKLSLEDFKKTDENLGEQLEFTGKVLESNFKDLQDIDFVIDDRTKVLHILQCRPSSRTAAASLRVAVDFVHERILNEREALMRIQTDKLDRLNLKPFFSPSDVPFASGTGSAAGIVQGRIFFTKEQCLSEYVDDESIIFCCSNFADVDEHIVKIAKGIICINTSVLNDVGRICRSKGVALIELVGCSIDLSVSSTHHFHAKPNRPIHDHQHKCWALTNVAGLTLREGSLCTVDGSSGRVYQGNIYDCSDSQWKPELKMVTCWADQFKKINVFCLANSTNAIEMRKMVESDLCDGFGHISTDLSFSLTDERLSLTETLISSKSLMERATAQAELLNIFRSEWREVFRICKGRPIVIYLLQHHLGLYFPNQHQASELAVNLNKDVSKMKETFCDLYAINPSFGLQGARTSITHPWITELQVRSVLEAAIDVRKEDPSNLVHVNICVSNCTSAEEVRTVTHQIHQIGQEILAENEMLDYPIYSVGCQIDTVKLALIVKDWIKLVSFVAFDTIKLTELILGIAIQDRHLFFGKYLMSDILPNDPFKTIDNDVFKIIQRCILIARKTCPNLTIGIDHCMQDERSISLFSSLPIQYLNVNRTHAASTKICCAQARINARSAGHKEHHFVDDHDSNFFANNFFPHFNLSG